MAGDHFLYREGLFLEGKSRRVMKKLGVCLGGIDTWSGSIRDLLSSLRGWELALFVVVNVIFTYRVRS